MKGFSAARGGLIVFAYEAVSASAPTPIAIEYRDGNSYKRLNLTNAEAYDLIDQLADALNVTDPEAVR